MASPQAENDETNCGQPLDVLIVGCGLGGLSCAIGCLQRGLRVRIIDKASEIGEIGAGIQVPPNAVRVMASYGLVSNLEKSGAIKITKHELLRYSDGKPVAVRPGDQWLQRHFGQSWYVIHRADYHQVLLEEARRLGVRIQLAAKAVAVNSSNLTVHLESGKTLRAEVIIGADGLHSVVRDEVLGYRSEPVETGDLAYRATIPKSCVHPSLQDDTLRAWIGPRQHAVLYPVRNKTCYNLVLLCADDLPKGVAKEAGDKEQMLKLFQGWDKRLKALIDNVDNVLKWRIYHMKELDTWCKDNVALLGDACHPTLPYQAQGAAMAIEDGATLAVLLSKFSKSRSNCPRLELFEVLQLYEQLRKNRTTTNVRGAIENRTLYHMPDGPESEARNKEFAGVDWNDPDSKFKWSWGNLSYLKDLMAVDTIKNAGDTFQTWVQKRSCN